ncbi:MAG: hypothetical protein DRG09_03780 [Epsilonproteobacteria bacterium]|nr:MAG: hypothetical protein DRG09_03780 [Campylobacterota bacterium]
MATFFMLGHSNYPLELFKQMLERRLLATLDRRIKRGTIKAPAYYDTLEFAYFVQAEKIAKVGMKKYQTLKKRIKK